MADNKVLWIFILFIFLFVENVSSLRCNACYSRQSLEDCRSEERSISCSDDHVCFTAEDKIFGDLKFYHKGCKRRDQCNPVSLCGSLSCKHYCCSSHHCNSAVPMTTYSKISLGITGLWILLLMK